MRVWDPLVRAFHWALVASILAAWVTANHLEKLHTQLGYLAGGLIAIRLVWGLIGSRHARFADFIRGPRAVLAYLRAIGAGRERRYLGHNPAGGAMILALIAAVAALIVTGWMMFTPTYYGVDWVAHLHGLIAHGLLVLIAVHLAGVVLASVRHRENLVRAMISGHKRAAEAGDVD